VYVDNLAPECSFGCISGYHAAAVLDASHYDRHGKVGRRRWNPTQDSSLKATNIKAQGAASETSGIALVANGDQHKAKSGASETSGIALVANGDQHKAKSGASETSEIALVANGDQPIKPRVQ
jgi:hypothetical protein